MTLPRPDDGRCTRYPISIEWPPGRCWRAGRRVPRRGARCAATRPARDHAIGIGVDRLDYTKGILERFSAVERLLELRAAMDRPLHVRPDRRADARRRSTTTSDYATRVRALADADQRALREGRASADHPHRPSITSRAQVYEYYRAADLCFVSSLHDGMNLVAKEFVAARDDEQGVLILVAVHRRVARTARGAGRQPVRRRPVRGGAAPRADDAAPTSSARACGSCAALVREFNVYRWAGRMLIDAA